MNDDQQFYCINPDGTLGVLCNGWPWPGYKSSNRVKRIFVRAATSKLQKLPKV